MNDQRIRAGIAALLSAGCIGVSMAVAAQSTSPPTAGPTVLVDRGHNNTGGSVQWLQDAGYVVHVLQDQFTDAALAEADLVLTAAPLAAQNALHLGPNVDTDAEVARAWRWPVPSAFSAHEISLLQAWVEQGGGLFVVFDHFPTPVAVAPLLARFGIEVSPGYAVDGRRLPPLPADEPALLGQAADLVFRRADGTLADHPVTNGRGAAERVDAVGTFTGSAFRLPPGGHSLLRFGSSFVSLLPEVAWEFSEDTPRQPIDGWSQGGLLRVGSGRLAVFGELGILVPPGTAFDTRHPDLQNPQLQMNVLRWLAGALDD